MYLTKTMCRDQLSASYLQDQCHSERLKVNSVNSPRLYNFWMGGGISIIFHRFMYLTKMMCREELSASYPRSRSHQEVEGNQCEFPSAP